MVEPGRPPLVAALVALLLAACAARPAAAPAPTAAPPADYRIPDGAFGRDPCPVSGEAAALDLDAAVRDFSEAYAGADGAPRLPSAGEIARARRALAARPRWSPASLAGALLDLFRCPDGHLAFGWDGRSPVRLEAWPREAREAPESAPDPVGGGAVTLVPGAVPRLVVRTFDSAAAPERARLPAIARRLRGLPAFVVDLRGNGGGNFAYAESFVLELTDATLRGLDEREVVSVAALEGRANSARRRIALGEVPREAEPVFRAHIDALEGAAEGLRALGGGARERVATGDRVRGRAPGPLRGRAVILVDGGCASACEMAVALARQIPGVVVAGDRTRGSMAVGELALFRLPRSGVTFWLGTRAFRDPSGRFAETRGFLPDVRLAGDESSAPAQAEALALGLHEAGAWPQRPARVEVSTPSRVSLERRRQPEELP